MSATPVLCTACGSLLDVPPGTVPGIVRCAACGKRIDLRKHLPDDAAVEVVAVPEVAAAATVRRRPAARSPWPVAAVVTACVAAAAAAAIWLARPTTPLTPTVPDLTGAATLPATAPAEPWGHAHRADLVRMKAAADALAIAGDLRGAHDGYQQLLSTAADHDVADPVAAQVVTDARAAQDRVFAALLAARPVPTRPAVTAPVTPPVARPVATRPTTVAVVAPPPPTRPTTLPVDFITAPGLPAPELRTYAPAGGLSDAEVGRAIDRAIVWLRANGGGNRKPTGNIADWAGSHDDGGLGERVLATYALINAGRATDRPGLGVREPAVVRALTEIKRDQLTQTYTRSLRAATLAVHNRIEDRSALEADVRWLVSAQRDGGYTYGVPTGPMVYDNSNSQYGLLGVWSGAQAGIGVPDTYWQNVMHHWVGCATPDGQWTYQAGGGGPYLSMTLAGTASLLVAHQYLDNPNGSLGGARARRAAAAVPTLNAALTWLEQGDHCVAGGDVGALAFAAYTNYGLERVGLASGFKYFGRHDWYAEVGRAVIDAQSADGSWDGSVINSSYDLLFLARGRAPLLFNKLRYAGDWNDRPYDVANLARFATRQLERPLNWQVVDLRRPWSDWADAPVLYLSGDAAPDLVDADFAALRDFALAGGMIVAHADNGSPTFTNWVRTQLVRRAFPKYELTRVPADHPLYTSLYKLDGAPPPLEAVDNGSRLLLVLCAADVAGGWRPTADAKGGTPQSQLGLNLFVYAAGRTNYRNRLESTYVPPPSPAPDGTAIVARLRYAGDWDPEPSAWPRFARTFAADAGRSLDVQTIDLKSLRPGQVPVAFLTGTVRQDFTPAEAAAAKAFVEAGGVLVVDACGGQEAFAKSVRTTLLPVAFPDVTIAPLPPELALFAPPQPGGTDARRLRLRPFASERLNAQTVPIDGAQVGRGWVIVSHLDLTVGLLGTQTWGVLGYDPAYAQAIVRNAILWAGGR